jgi:hypothetical protein
MDAVDVNKRQGLIGKGGKNNKALTNRVKKVYHIDLEKISLKFIEELGEA